MSLSVAPYLMMLCASYSQSGYEDTLPLHG